MGTIFGRNCTFPGSFFVCFGVQATRRGNRCTYIRTVVAHVETYHVDVLDVVDHAVVVRFKLFNVEGRERGRENEQKVKY